MTTVEDQECNPPTIRGDVVAATPASDIAAPRASKLSLTDFLDVETLQEIQDSFTAVTRLAATILDADGQPVTAPTDTHRRAAGDELLEQLIDLETDAEGSFIAPIVVEGQQLGSITIEHTPFAVDSETFQKQLHELAERLKLSDDEARHMIESLEATLGPNRAAGVQFLHLMANSLARLCYETYQARMRIEELAVLYKVSTTLSGTRDVQRVMDVAVESIAEVMKVMGVTIRLLSDDGEQNLVPRAVHGLSRDYMQKGTIRLPESQIFKDAFEHGICIIEDMTTDPRTLFPESAKREGMASMLCAPMVFQGEPIGVLQVFTSEPRRFSRFEQQLIRSMSQLLSTAIESTRLEVQREENERLSRQLTLAADVQRRMLPLEMPKVDPLDVAARYVPSYELSGDFFDFLPLERHLGVVVGDVVGKGVAASLRMASVRASVRAFAQDIYDINDIIERVNVALCNDTRDDEFVTLFYGVFDPDRLRLSYCNAGHEPPLLLHQGDVYPLTTGGMILGVDQQQQYEVGLFDLQIGDAMLLYTDGLTEAMNYQGEQFGRKRVEQALRESGDGCASDILNHVLWQKRRFTGVQRWSDDLTIVVVKVGTPPCPEVDVYESGQDAR